MQRLIGTCYVLGLWSSACDTPTINLLLDDPMGEHSAGGDLGADAIRWLLDVSS